MKELVNEKSDLITKLVKLEVKKIKKNYLNLEKNR